MARSGISCSGSISVENVAASVEREADHHLFRRFSGGIHAGGFSQRAETASLSLVAFVDHKNGCFKELPRRARLHGGSVRGSDDQNSPISLISARASLHI